MDKYSCGEEIVVQISSKEANQKRKGKLPNPQQRDEDILMLWNAALNTIISRSDMDLDLVPSDIISSERQDGTTPTFVLASVCVKRDSTEEDTEEAKVVGSFKLQAFDGAYGSCLYLQSSSYADVATTALLRTRGRLGNILVRDEKKAAFIMTAQLMAARAIMPEEKFVEAEREIQNEFREEFKAKGWEGFGVVQKRYFV